MKVVKKLMALVLASALALTLLTGCGGGGGGNSSVTINGQTMTINKARVGDFEKAFENKMAGNGYADVTYSAEMTNLLEKALKEGAKQNSAATQVATNYVGMSGAVYFEEPNWADVADTVVAGYIQLAVSDNVDFAGQSYGYIRVTKPKSGVTEIVVLIGGNQKSTVV